MKGNKPSTFEMLLDSVNFYSFGPPFLSRLWWFHRLQAYLNNRNSPTSSLTDQLIAFCTYFGKTRVRHVTDTSNLGARHFGSSSVCINRYAKPLALTSFTEPQNSRRVCHVTRSYSICLCV